MSGDGWDGKNLISQSIFKIIYKIHLYHHLNHQLNQRQTSIISWDGWISNQTRSPSLIRGILGNNKSYSYPYKNQAGKSDPVPSARLSLPNFSFRYHWLFSSSQSVSALFNFRLSPAHLAEVSETIDNSEVSPLQIQSLHTSIAKGRGKKIVHFYHQKTWRY